MPCRAAASRTQATPEPKKPRSLRDTANGPAYHATTATTIARTRTATPVSVIAIVTVLNTVSATPAGMSDGETELMKTTRPIAIPAMVTTMAEPKRNRRPHERQRATTCDSNTRGEEEQGYPGQPCPDAHRQSVEELQRRHGGVLRDRDGPVNGRDLGSKRQPPLHQYLLDAFDDGPQLDADRPIRADRDRRIGVVLHGGDELRVADPQRLLPHLRERVGLDERADCRPDQRDDALCDRPFQRLERGGGRRSRSEIGDAVDDLCTQTRGCRHSVE